MVRYWMAGVVLALAGCQAGGAAPATASRSMGTEHPLRACALVAPAVQAWDFQQTAPVAADLDGDRAAEILVAAGADGGALSVYRLQGRALAASESYPLPAGGAVVALAAGDVDRDGHPDAVALVRWFDPQQGNSFGVAAYLNDGRGRLRPPLLSGPFAGAAEGPMKVADLDGDGLPDLVARTMLQQGLYGDGHGGFALRTPEVFGEHIEVGDFDEDGRPDLLTLGCGADRCTLALLLGQGGGGFRSAAGSLPTGTWANGPLASGDLDGDGHLDALYWGQQGLTALYGDGRGGLGGAADLGSGPDDVGEVRVGDVDGDGRLDVLLIREGGGVRLFLNQGGRSFREGPEFFGPLAQSSRAGNDLALLAADLDGDGRTDLAFDASGGVEVALADGRGGFSPADTAPYRGNGLFGADLRGDGTTLLATGWPQSVLALGADGGLGQVGTLEPTWPDGGYNLEFEPVDAVDFDRDGHLDLVGFARRSNWIEAVEVLRGDGRGNLAYGARAPWKVSPYTGIRLAVGDLNRDGYPDLVASNDQSCEVQVVLNDRKGGLAPPVAYPAGACSRGSARRGGTGPAGVAVGDFDGDRLPDVAMLNTQEHALYLFPGDGRGGLGAPRLRPLAGAELASGDLDGDGLADLVVFDPTGGKQPQVLPGARGGLGVPKPLPWPRENYWLTRLWVRDLDGDGNLDVALGGFAGTALYLGDGQGRFSDPLESPIPSASGLAVGPLLPGGRRELLFGGLPGLAGQPQAATRATFDCH